MTTTPNRLRIGELAAEFGLNPKTIRYYESVGLLPEPPRTDAGYRLYGAADRDRLRFIRKARAIGLTLEEIGEVLALRHQGRRPCEHVVGLLDAKLGAIDEHVRALEDFRAELATLRGEAAETMTADACVCGVIEQHEPSHDGDAVQGYMVQPFRPRRTGGRRSPTS